MSNFRRHLEFHPGTDPPSFTTTVDDVLPDGGVVLSESWCYPKGGGQPGDTGVLKLDGESIPFGEVTATNAIIHPVEDPTLEVGDEVECVIDGARRNALARMHSAAHIVSLLRMRGARLQSAPAQPSHLDGPEVREQGTVRQGTTLRGCQLLPTMTRGSTFMSGGVTRYHR